jgi:hypothetical protein
MSFTLAEHKKEIIFVCIVLVLVYWYYTNYYVKGKHLTSVFAKTPAQPVVVSEPVAQRSAEVVDEAVENGVEEFSNDIKFKEDSLRKLL